MGEGEIDIGDTLDCVVVDDGMVNKHLFQKRYWRYKGFGVKVWVSRVDE